VPSRVRFKPSRSRTTASPAVLVGDDDADPAQVPVAALAAKSFPIPLRPSSPDIQYTEASGAHRPGKAAASPVTHATAPDLSERIRAILHEHKVRARIFRGSALVDTGWNMLLDLMLAHLEGRQIYLSSLCVASGLPITNGKRRVAQLIADGLVRRDSDQADRRRVLVSLTDSGLERLFAYLDQIERGSAQRDRA